jgi:hypothetical protein
LDRPALGDVAFYLAIASPASVRRKIIGIDAAVFGGVPFDSSMRTLSHPFLALIAEDVRWAAPDPNLALIVGAAQS